MTGSEGQRKLAELMNVQYLFPISRGWNSEVFKADSARGPVAIKCIRGEGLRRSAQEQRLAKWAGDVGLGPPVHATENLSSHACIVMACATSDLRAVMACADAHSFAALRRLWSHAFKLVASRHLWRRRLICSDLKPANILVFNDGTAPPACRLAGAFTKPLSAAEVRLNDFDPAFWGKASKALGAVCFNVLALLSNTLFLLPASGLAFFPEAALVVAHHAILRDERIIATLRERDVICSRGVFRYAGAADLEDYLGRLGRRLEGRAKPTSLEAALAELGFTPADRPRRRSAG